MKHKSQPLDRSLLIHPKPQSRTYQISYIPLFSPPHAIYVDTENFIEIHTLHTIWNSVFFLLVLLLESVVLIPKYVKYIIFVTTRVTFDTLIKKILQLVLLRFFYHGSYWGKGNNTCGSNPSPRRVDIAFIASWRVATKVFVMALAVGIGGYSWTQNLGFQFRALFLDWSFESRQTFVGVSHKD